MNPSPEDDDELVETAKEDLTSLEEVLHGSVARIVLKNALLSIPDSLSFRGSILEVLIGMPLPGTEILVDDLYADLQVLSQRQLPASMNFSNAVTIEREEPRQHLKYKIAFTHLY